MGPRWVWGTFQTATGECHAVPHVSYLPCHILKWACDITVVGCTCISLVSSWNFRYRREWFLLALIVGDVDVYVNFITASKGMAWLTYFLGFWYLIYLLFGCFELYLDFAEIKCLALKDPARWTAPCRFETSLWNLWSLLLQRSKVHGAYSETSWSSACWGAGGRLQEYRHRLPPQLGWLCSLGTKPLAVSVQQQHPPATAQLPPRAGTYRACHLMNITVVLECLMSWISPDIFMPTWSYPIKCNFFFYVSSKFYLNIYYCQVMYLHVDLRSVQYWAVPSIALAVI